MRRLALAALLLAGCPAAGPSLPDGVAVVQSNGRTLVVGCPRCLNHAAEHRALAQRDEQLAANVRQALDQLRAEVAAQKTEAKPE